MEHPVVIQMDDPSRVAEVRRAVLAIAEREGLDETSIANSAIVATELATNLSKHAKQGEIHVLSLFERGLQGVEILSIDHGPGIANLEQSFRDGYSTSQTTGTGLGAVKRLSTEFDIYSVPGRGTVIFTRILGNKGAAAAPPNFVVGVAAKAVQGENVSGDAWAARFGGNFVLLIIADGLGHGMQASEASSEAIRTFIKSPEESPVEVLKQIHLALRGSRGAAVSVARIEFENRQVRFAGLGNVAGVVIGRSGPQAPKLQSMISHNGTAGHEFRQIKEFIYPFNPEDILVMHSDGLTGHWDLPGNPGLLNKHPSVIAGSLYRDCARLKDDVCVLVGKKQ